ncbi:pectate lyase family protein [Pseudogemmobacter bohemicus]|uniref:hypothetical protein n=1 Tax=Pseudogemmobacter bohemicus TaxID=2250708 RepID=UPI0013002F0C|nr:hypothetical protein [Pseudogemmobacter bohemicus]
MAAGVTTPNLVTTSLADSLVVNRDGNTMLQKIGNLAVQLLADPSFSATAFAPVAVFRSSLPDLRAEERTPGTHGAVLTTDETAGIYEMTIGGWIWRAPIPAILTESLAAVEARAALEETRAIVEALGPLTVLQAIAEGVNNALIMVTAATCSTPFNTPLAFGADPAGVADSRASFLSADGLREIYVPTGTYRIASNLTITRPVQFADGAKIVVPAGITVHMARGFTADPYTHCFDISGGGTVTVGAAPMGYVTPQHWGARGIGAGHDDWPAITAASRAATLNTIREEYAESVPVRFPPVPAYYRVTQTWFVTRTALFYGDNPTPLRGQKGIEIRGANGIAAVLAVLYPGGVSGIGVYKPENPPDHPTAPGFGLKFGGLRSRFRNLNFFPEVGATVRQGVVHNATAFFEYCASAGFAEADWHAHAQASGLAVNLFDHPNLWPSPAHCGHHRLRAAPETSRFIIRADTLPIPDRFEPMALCL